MCTAEYATQPFEHVAEERVLALVMRADTGKATTRRRRRCSDFAHKQAVVLSRKTYQIKRET